MCIRDSYGVTVTPVEAGMRPEGAPPWNLGATLEKIRNDFDTGIITAEKYQMAIDYWRSKQARFMESLRRRAEQQ